MSDNRNKELGFDTRAVRHGQVRTDENEHSEAIFMTSSYVFDNAAQAQARFSGEEPGNIYSRFTNPTVRTFEQRLASLEGGDACVATASGMSAILATMLALLQSGDHIVSSGSLFGATIGLFDNYLGKFGIEVSYVSQTDVDAWEAEIRDNTRLFYLESPSNPLTEVADIAYLASLATANDVLLVVDNCFCTPALQRPLELGADIVIHSATKYLDGHGRAVGGAVVGSNELVGEKVFSFMRTAGPTMSPFNAWLFTRGLETLSLRMKAHTENAARIAQWLESHEAVSRVYYPGLVSHPQHALVTRQQDDYGSIVAFEINGSQDDAWRVVDSLQVFSITANLGDVKSTITHPATTTHARITPEQRKEAGIGDNLLRLAIGLETCDDLIEDLGQALDQMQS